MLFVIFGNNFSAKLYLEFCTEIIPLSIFVGFMEGKAQVIFLTPEKAVDPKWMKRIITYYGSYCIAIAFDEANCISEW